MIRVAVTIWWSLVGLVACASPTSYERGTVIAVEDQSRSELITLPSWPETRIDSASSRELAAWLLPASAGTIVRHSIHPQPPTASRSVALYGPGRLIEAGICKRQAWFVNIAPEPPNFEFKPSHRSTSPRYALAPGKGCADPQGGISAASDSEAIALLKRYRAARDALARGGARLRCVDIDDVCTSVFESLTPDRMDAAFFCLEQRRCAQYQFGYTYVIQVFGGASRPTIEVSRHQPPVF